MEDVQNASAAMSMRSAPFWDFTQSRKWHFLTDVPGQLSISSSEIKQSKTPEEGTDVSKRRYGNTILRCAKYQKSADLNV